MIHKVWMTKYEVKNIQLCIMTTNRLILATGREKDSSSMSCFFCYILIVFVFHITFHKAARHDIAEILLRLALNTNQSLQQHVHDFVYVSI